tara:strand:- start:124 stop:912 length:789 start_codon:yes stop_codon:yes gene_type:complete
MEVLFLGTGSAFAMKNWQSNILLRHNGKNCLFDAGGDVRHSLAENGFSYTDVDGVIITHEHADHTGGLEYLGFCNYYDPEYKNQMKLFAEKDIVPKLWENTLKGGMAGDNCQFNDYFEITPVDTALGFTWQGIKIDLVKCAHIPSETNPMYSYGIMYTNPYDGQRVYITSDCQFSPETMMVHYQSVDVIYHDCETMYKSGVHSHYDDLKTLPADIKAKMWLYHYQDNVVENWDDWQAKAKADGFAGFVKKGQIFPHPLEQHN